jgi:hypothetical protein
MYDLQNVLERAERVCTTSQAVDRIQEIEFTQGYAEPGYDDPESGTVALGNWNEIHGPYNEQSRTSEVLDKTPDRLAAILERMGIGIEWSDEWYTCSDCGKCFRCSADSYCWQMSGVLTEYGDCVCCDCLDPVEHLESLEGQDSKCNTIDSIDPADHNYTRIPLDFENGWYGGQSADPKTIGDTLAGWGIERYLFNLDSTGQFDISFSVWIHNSELSKDPTLETITHWLENGKTDGPDPAEMMKKALQSAPMIPSEPGKISYTKCHPDGTATTRNVSVQEFIDGIKE